jgi:hypothetical protein
MLQALQWAGREFARVTGSFQDDLRPIPVTAYQRDYSLTSLHNYDASIHRLISARLNGSDLDRDDYELRNEVLLRFATQKVPNDTLDDQMLLCGLAGVVTPATWAAIAAGSVGIELAGGDEDLTGIDFSGCTSMDDVALTIQTAWRTAMGSNVGYIQWFWSSSAQTAGRFVLWADGGTAGYLTAGTAGTDISGAGYMNGLTGGTGVSLAPCLEVRTAFRPDVQSQTLPSWYMDRYAEMLVAGALVHLATMPNVERMDKDAAAIAQAVWNDALNEGMAELNKKFTSGGVRIGA